MTLIAAPDANPTPDGQGAPVVVRIYQLGSTAAFNSAEFFPLYHQDSTTLGPDLIKKDEVLLTPGTSKPFSYQPPETVHAIGIFAAYADFQHVTWRADTVVMPHQTTTVTVTAGSAGLTLTTKSGTP